MGVTSEAWTRTLDIHRSWVILPHCGAFVLEYSCLLWNVALFAVNNTRTFLPSSVLWVQLFLRRGCRLVDVVRTGLKHFLLGLGFLCENAIQIVKYRLCFCIIAGINLSWFFRCYCLQNESISWLIQTNSNVSPLPIIRWLDYISLLEVVDVSRVLGACCHLPGKGAFFPKTDVGLSQWCRGAGFDSGPWSSSLVFACPLRACIGFLRVHCFPSTFQKNAR